MTADRKTETAGRRRRLVEELAAYLIPAKALGCDTVWLTQNGAAASAYVEHVIRDLTEVREIDGGR